MSVYPNLTYSAQGLSVTFTDKSLGTIDSRTWKFGDGTVVVSTVDEPLLTITHEYSDWGYKEVTLSLQEVTPEGGTAPDPMDLVVSFRLTEAGTTIIKPVIASVWDRIPTTLRDSAVKYSDLFLTVNHWRVYLAPLFSPGYSPETSEESWTLDQLQLLEEIVFWDVLNSKIQSYLLGMVSSNPVGSGSQSGTITGSGSGSSISGASRGSLKRVTTGPTEVEWFTVAESMKTTATTEDYTKQLEIVAKPGGLISQIASKVCLFARGEKIQLPICPNLDKPVFPPSIAKNR